ncbi:hypothetical protein BJV74DRAFT_796526 [Russula compacta]|nr:hypothetical protein BJV74DRAFT_796526 [Russula compacta]
MHVIKAFFKEKTPKGRTMMETAATLLENQAFAYKDFNTNNQVATFQSQPLLLLLGLTHLQPTQGWVDVPGLDLPLKCNYGIRGLKWDFLLAAAGMLDQDDGEEPQVPTTAHNNPKLPWTLNKATGKESTRGSTFSLQNWGGITLSYHNSISNCNLDTLGNIVTVKQSLSGQLEHNPHAQMFLLHAFNWTGCCI